eukprot:CAMPEP_0117430274 /NCGR_PEP_ID=MMETSP0758-20121206/9800_1 /TAXON_ID=63605 /ORGANISM="Percolomonas cosmopolitus, Strain AE-1 (ATCC 50343)" /LENGTH=1105 /DNA_ID=CAMNT_0005218103 /DNA_START=842 /DNA_END=4159 /DNA_ORIENTATION=-
MNDKNDVYCWGDNTFGAPGVGSKEKIVKTPTKVESELFGQVEYLQTSGSTTRFLVDGVNYFSGKMIFSKLFYDKPYEVYQPAVNMNFCLKQDCLYFFDSKGILFRVGYNFIGGNYDHSPTIVELEHKVIDIAVGSDHMLILDDHHNVWSMGNNKDFQLGINVLSSITPKQIKSLENQIVRIATGSKYSIVISASGVVSGFGYNYYGQLGTGDFISRKKIMKPTDFKSFSNLFIVEVYAGYASTFFLNNEGNILACGRNEHGQLGVGETYNINYPREVNIDVPIKDIAVGEGHTLFLSTNGDLLMAGLIMNEKYPLLIPKFIKGVHGVTEIAAGEELSIIKQSNNVLVRGNYRYGRYENFTKLDDLENCKHLDATHEKDVFGICYGKIGFNPFLRCTPGYTFKNNTCVPCDEGYQCPIEDIKEACPAGTYSYGKGSYSCFKCPPSTYSPSKFASNPQTCQICSQQNYVAQKGTACDICPIGHYCPSPGEGAKQCPKGTFGPTVGMTLEEQCIPCQNGSICPLGSFVQGKVCEDGKYAKDYTTCKHCIKGHYCKNGIMEPCERNMYAEASQSTCIICPTGYYCKNASTKMECPEGHFCPDYTSEIMPCHHGTYSEAKQGSCKLCSVGTYTDQMNQTKCKKAPAITSKGSFLPLLPELDDINLKKLIKHNDYHSFLTYFLEKFSKPNSLFQATVFRILVYFLTFIINIIPISIILFLIVMPCFLRPKRKIPKRLYTWLAKRDLYNREHFVNAGNTIRVTKTPLGGAFSLLRLFLIVWLMLNVIWQFIQMDTKMNVEKNKIFEEKDYSFTTYVTIRVGFVSPYENSLNCTSFRINGDKNFTLQKEYVSSTSTTEFFMTKILKSDEENKNMQYEFHFDGDIHTKIGFIDMKAISTTLYDGEPRTAYKQISRYFYLTGDQIFCDENTATIHSRPFLYLMIPYSFSSIKDLFNRYLFTVLGGLKKYFQIPFLIYNIEYDGLSVPKHCLYKSADNYPFNLNVILHIDNDDVDIYTEEFIMNFGAFFTAIINTFVPIIICSLIMSKIETLLNYFDNLSRRSRNNRFYRLLGLIHKTYSPLLEHYDDDNDDEDNENDVQLDNLSEDENDASDYEA